MGNGSSNDPRDGFPTRNETRAAPDPAEMPEPPWESGDTDDDERDA